MIKTADVEWAQEVCPACESAWQDDACPTCGLTREDVNTLLAEARLAYTDAHVAATEGRIDDALAFLAEARRLGLHHDTADRLEAICAAVEGRQPRSPWLLPFRWRETLHAGEATGLYLAAREAADGGDWEATLALLEGCLGAAPWLRPGHQLKALALCALDRPAEAMAVCDTFLAELPGDLEMQRYRKAIAGEPKAAASQQNQPTKAEPAAKAEDLSAPSPTGRGWGGEPAADPVPVRKPRVRKEHPLLTPSSRRPGGLISAALVCGVMGGYLLGHEMGSSTTITNPAAVTRPALSDRSATAPQQSETAALPVPVVGPSPAAPDTVTLAAPLAKEADEARQEAAETVAQRWLNEAVSEQKSGSPKRAEELADAAAGLGKGSYLEDSAILLAAQMAERRKQPDAAQRYASLVERVPKSNYAGFALHHAARAATALGHTDEAQGYIAKLLTGYPDSRWAKRYRDKGLTSPERGPTPALQSGTEGTPIGHKDAPARLPLWRLVPKGGRR